MQSLCALAKEKGTDNNASCGNSQDNDCPFLHYCQVCSVSRSGLVASLRMTLTINILVSFLNLLFEINFSQGC